MEMLMEQLQERDDFVLCISLLPKASKDDWQAKEEEDVMITWKLANKTWDLLEGLMWMVWRKKKRLNRDYKSRKRELQKMHSTMQKRKEMQQ